MFVTSHAYFVSAKIPRVSCKYESSAALLCTLKPNLITNIAHKYRVFKLELQSIWLGIKPTQINEITT